jgi:hypothetical protein
MDRGCKEHPFFLYQLLNAMDIDKVNKVLELTDQYKKLKDFHTSVTRTKGIAFRDHNGSKLSISLQNKKADDNTNESKWEVTESQLSGQECKSKIAELTEWYYGAVIREIERDIEEINKQLLSL